MFDLTNIYNITKELDELFASHYDDKQELIRKNRLELLVELGELANETRCFKYWSVRQTGDKDKILEEYIDCLSMALFFANLTDISLDEEFPDSLNEDMINTFLKLFEYASNETLEKEDIKKIIVELDHLAKLLDFTIEDLEKIIEKKRDIINDRFNSGY